MLDSSVAMNRTIKLGASSQSDTTVSAANPSVNDYNTEWTTEKPDPISETEYSALQKKLLHDQIIVARYGVTCCVADATVYGIMARGDVAHLPLDEWLQLTGTIEQTNYDGSTISIIKIYP